MYAHVPVTIAIILYMIYKVTFELQNDVPNLTTYTTGLASHLGIHFQYIPS